MFAQHRLSICRACPSFVETAAGLHQCTECSCIMELKALIPWVSCPLKHWSAVAENTDAAARDVIINDMYLSLGRPNTGYVAAVRAKYAELFADADPATLYAELVNRRARN